MCVGCVLIPVWSVIPWCQSIVILITPLIAVQETPGLGRSLGEGNGYPLQAHNPLYMRVLLALCLDHSMNLLSIHAASSILHWLLEFFPKHMHWYSKIFKTVIFIVILSAPKSLVASNCQSSKVQTGWRTPANGVRFAPIPSPLLCVSAHTPCKPLRCHSLWSNHSALWQMLYINPCI